MEATLSPRDPRLAGARLAAAGELALLASTEAGIGDRRLALASLEAAHALVLDSFRAGPLGDERTDVAEDEPGDRDPFDEIGLAYVGQS